MPAGPRRRNILFVTVDQQSYDALGITGHPFARTPVVDAFARDGVLYRRAHVRNVVRMPSRATMLTGQHPLTHSVVANGIPLDDASPNEARELRAAGYRQCCSFKLLPSFPRRRESSVLRWTPLGPRLCGGDDNH